MVLTRYLCCRMVGVFVFGLIAGVFVVHLQENLLLVVVDSHNSQLPISTGDVLHLPTEDFVQRKSVDNLVKVSHENQTSQRKILLDCGANVASTVELFRNTYPGGREFVIYSFELDSRLAPYFHPYSNHYLNCPVAVASENGNMTVYTESAWSPNRGKNGRKDMQWGGGTLFVFEKEAADTLTGGSRKLAVRPTIPTIDLSRWIQENTNKDDYVIFKLDVEGAEYDILKKMLKEHTFEWIDKFYGEFHGWQPVSGWTNEQKKTMASTDIKKSGLTMIDWAAEKRTYKDFDQLHPVKVSEAEPGVSGNTYSACGETNKVAVTVSLGMNVKRARKIVDILAAYPGKIPVMLFVYGEFSEIYPDDVKRWANRFDVGMREDGYCPPGHFEMMGLNWIRESLCSTELRLQELDIQPVFYLPVNATSANIIKIAKQRGFRLIKPTVNFPPKKGTTLQVENYYKFRDVERVPKALRILDAELVKNHGGIITLDSDLPDTRMNLVFLLDYLVQTSGFELVSVKDCVSSYTLQIGA